MWFLLCTDFYWLNIKLLQALFSFSVHVLKCHKCHKLNTCLNSGRQFLCLSRQPCKNIIIGHVSNMIGSETVTHGYTALSLCLAIKIINYFLFPILISLLSTHNQCSQLSLMTKAKCSSFLRNMNNFHVPLLSLWQKTLQSPNSDKKYK